MDNHGFGITREKKEATIYTMTNAHGMSVRVTDYGATLVSIQLTNQDGMTRDVILGYDDVNGYEEGSSCFGATIGRNAGRIKGAAFSLNGKDYVLAANEGHNNLHSGPDGFDSRMWKAHQIGKNELAFSLHSPDGDQGYPGNLKMEVIYHLTDDNELQLTYRGLSDQDTIWNPTNHGYYNLDGHDSGTVESQKVRIDADAFTPIDTESIPTGEIVDVTGTPMDYRKKKAIGQDIQNNDVQLQLGNGYDHNWVLNGNGFRKVAEMESTDAALVMEVYTDLPGVQYYTANYVSREVGKDGTVYHSRQAACFETQYFPSACNIETFDTPMLQAGKEKISRTTYKFIWK